LKTLRRPSAKEKVNVFFMKQFFIARKKKTLGLDQASHRLPKGKFVVLFQAAAADGQKISCPLLLTKGGEEGAKRIPSPKRGEF